MEGSRAVNVVLDAPRYLFVSTNVAQMFPDLLESVIIRSYHSYLPGEIGNKWKFEPTYYSNFWRVGLGSNRGKKFILTAVILSGLQQLGASSPTVQRVTIHLLQPLAICGLSILWLMLWENPLWCIPIGLIILYKAGQYCHNKRNEHRNAVAVLPLSGRKRSVSCSEAVVSSKKCNDKVFPGDIFENPVDVCHSVESGDMKCTNGNDKCLQAVKHIFSAQPPLSASLARNGVEIPSGSDDDLMDSLLESYNDHDIASALFRHLVGNDSSSSDCRDSSCRSSRVPSQPSTANTAQWDDGSDVSEDSAVHDAAKIWGNIEVEMREHEQQICGSEQLDSSDSDGWDSSERYDYQLDQLWGNIEAESTARSYSSSGVWSGGSDDCKQVGQIAAGDHHDFGYIKVTRTHPSNVEKQDVVNRDSFQVLEATGQWDSGDNCATAEFEKVIDAIFPESDSLECEQNVAFSDCEQDDGANSDSQNGKNCIPQDANVKHDCTRPTSWA